MHTEDLLRVVVETVVDGIITIDEKGIIISANPAVREIFGYDLEDLIGSDVRQLMPEPYCGEHESYLNNYASTGESKIIGIGREVKGLKKDGTPFPLELSVGETITDDGKIYTGVLRDISARKRVEDDLERERALLKAVVETAVDGILTINGDGIIGTVNHAAEMMFGYSASDLIGQNVRMLMPAPYRDEHDGYLQNYKVTGERKVIGIGREVHGLRKNGEVFPMDLAVSETKIDRGVVYTGIVRDISDRKRIEMNSRESEERFRFLNDLAGAMRVVSSPEEVMAVTARMLGQHLKASRCAYANVGEDGDEFEILHDFTDGCASTVGSYRLALFGAKAVDILGRAETLVLRDVGSELEPDDGADMFQAIGIGAVIVCPLVKDGALRAMMAVHQTEPRNWQPQEITLVEDVVERCWATIERIHAEQALQRQQSELRALFDLMPAMIWFKDANNRILRINKRVAEAAGLPVDQIEGRRSDEVYPLDADRFYEDDLAVIRSGEPKLGFVETLRGPDGRELWVQTDKVPVKDKDGTVVGIVVMGQDISERRRSEEQVRLLGSAVEQSTESILITDAELDLPGPRILFVNPAFTKMTGYSAEEAIGSTPRILQGSKTDREVLSKLRTTLERGEVFEGEAINYKKDGSEYLQYWQVVPLRNETQTVTHYVAVLRDVTEIKKNEQALKTAFQEIEEQVEVRTAALAEANFDLRVAMERADASSKAKSEFLSRMSHELRTPMNSVLGYAQLLTLQYADPGIQDSAGCILRSGNHLLQMINEVLDLSRIESGELAVSQEPVDFLNVLNQAISLVQPLANNAQVEIKVPAEEQGELFIHADRQRLLQVLINLLGNAIKYNRRPGLVTVSWLHVDEGIVRIEFSDTGRGISESDRANLFQPFQRFGDLDVEGTGLGLALSQRYVMLMGGALGLDASSPEGSVFYLELKEADPTANPSRDKEAGGLGLTMLTGLRGSILYVEDNPSNMRLMETVLNGVPDIILIPAIQGSMGIDLARQHKPSLILLDLHLPDMRGDEVLHELKKNALTAHIPVVMLSADATQKQIDHLLKQGANDYLTKPIDLVRFFDILRSFLPAIT